MADALANEVFIVFCRNWYDCAAAFDLDPCYFVVLNLGRFVVEAVRWIDATIGLFSLTILQTTKNPKRGPESTVRL
jgi:hypothetical protein